jgi:hypothetical protein
MKTRIVLLAILLLFFSQIAMGAIDNRLVFVSNYKDPQTGKAILTLDIEAKGDGTAHRIEGYQTPFQIKGRWISDVDTVTYSNLLFPDQADDEGYLTSLRVISTEDSLFGLVWPSFNYVSGERTQIPATDDFFRIMTLQIEYEPVDSTGTIDWWLPGVAPTMVVTTPDGNIITGEALDIPAELQNFTLNPQIVPVELASFEAQSTEGMVQLDWQTASETDNLGFHILRSPSESGEFSRINSEMIPGAGNSNSERVYSFADKDVNCGSKYFYKLIDVDSYGNEQAHGPVQVTVMAPQEYALEQNYPNPFNPETTIQYKIKETGHVTLQIFNTRGQVVRTLVDDVMQPGSYEKLWDGMDNQGIPAASGTYFYRMKTNGFDKYHKMQLLK